jgi:hypothetical protein
MKDNLMRKAFVMNVVVRNMIIRHIIDHKKYKRINCFVVAAAAGLILKYRCSKISNKHIQMNVI